MLGVPYTSKFECSECVIPPSLSVLGVSYTSKSKCLECLTPPSLSVWSALCLQVQVVEVPYTSRVSVQCLIPPLLSVRGPLYPLSLSD